MLNLTFSLMEWLLGQLFVRDFNLSDYFRELTVQIWEGGELALYEIILELHESLLGLHQKFHYLRDLLRFNFIRRYFIFDWLCFTCLQEVFQYILFKSFDFRCEFQSRLLPRKLGLINFPLGRSRPLIVYLSLIIFFLLICVLSLWHLT